MEVIKSFDKWMRTKVKSIYYSDNEQMCKAYERLNK